MNSYLKEATVGLMVLIATAIFVTGGIWLRGRTIGPPDVQVMFAQIGTLKEGAPVRISGAPVGRVSEITFLGVGQVRVGLAFSLPIVPTQAARAVIVSVGMLGDAEIEFDPGQGTPLAPGEVIQGSMAAGLFDKGSALADQAAATMKSFNAMMDTALVADLRRTLRTTERLMNYLADHRNGPTAEVNATLKSLQGASSRLDSTLVALDPAGTRARLDTTMQSVTRLTDQLAATSARADSLMAKINRGEGTLGKFATDTTLYADLHKTLDAMSALIDELRKHPGKIGITVRIPG
jgi:phospholipid/cholesterol/gamma-HCH transport system substrate-binding protein